MEGSQLSRGAPGVDPPHPLRASWSSSALPAVSWCSDSCQGFFCCFFQQLIDALGFLLHRKLHQKKSCSPRHGNAAQRFLAAPLGAGVRTPDSPLTGTSWSGIGAPDSSVSFGPSDPSQSHLTHPLSTLFWKHESTQLLPLRPGVDADRDRETPRERWRL